MLTTVHPELAAVEEAIAARWAGRADATAIRLHIREGGKTTIAVSASSLRNGYNLNGTDTTPTQKLEWSLTAWVSAPLSRPSKQSSRHCALHGPTQSQPSSPPFRMPSLHRGQTVPHDPPQST